MPYKPGSIYNLCSSKSEHPEKFIGTLKDAVAVAVKIGGPVVIIDLLFGPIWWINENGLIEPFLSGKKS